MCWHEVHILWKRLFQNILAYWTSYVLRLHVITCFYPLLSWHFNHGSVLCCLYKLTIPLLHLSLTLLPLGVVFSFSISNLAIYVLPLFVLWYNFFLRAFDYLNSSLIKVVFVCLFLIGYLLLGCCWTNSPGFCLDGIKLQTRIYLICR